MKPLNDKCPICNSTGDDLIVKFYCSNPDCQNYKKDLYKVNDHATKPSMYDEEID